MTDAEILEDRRARVEMLLAMIPDGPMSQVGLDQVAGDPASLASAVDPERLMGHVRSLAQGPRGNVTDTEAALRAARYVEAQLAEVGLAPEVVEAHHSDVTLPVVHVTVPPAGGAAGEGPVPTVVLVAHYDTVPGSPGADDNASGVAGLLEIARLLPRHTLPFAIVLGAVPFEESFELAGSAALAGLLAQDPTVDVRAAISAEMLGYATAEPRVTGERGDDLLLVGFEGSQHVIDVVVAAAERWSPGAVRGLAVPEGVPEVERSDHAAFHRHGVPALMATDGAEFRNPHYHQASDTPATLDPDFLAGSTVTLAVGLMALASGC